MLYVHCIFQKFNPTEFFEDVLIEREYIECTSSAIQALTLFMKLHRGHRTMEIEDCISRAVKYIKDAQNPDGSLDALVACGYNYHNSPAIQKSCEFLLSKQLPDGGWGESYLSSANKTYTNLDGNRSNLVQTSWALMSLIKAGQAEIDLTPINNGTRLLINSQMKGDFPQQEITGVFMRNCTLNYSAYRNIFPIWALVKPVVGGFHLYVVNVYFGAFESSVNLTKERTAPKCDLSLYV
ncbi:lupeol synthase [Tanacetum coccineum]|uniref:Lupeol synthase n=1 Tax=Tanacetum coccineum TaxID=301880 RepID=A0ABQ4XTM9_9ASTR